MRSRDDPPSCRDSVRRLAVHPSRSYAASAALLEPSAISADLVVSPPTVSHRLKQLRDVGPLISRRCSTWVYYRLAPDALAAITAVLAPAS